MYERFEDNDMVLISSNDLIMVSSKSIKYTAEKFSSIQRKNFAVVSLYEDTKMKANREHKVPVVVLHLTNKKVFLIIADMYDLENIRSEII